MKSLFGTTRAGIMTILVVITIGFQSCDTNDNNPVPKDTTPKVTSVLPASVHFGDTLEIAGSNFSTVPANNLITLNDMPATVISANATLLKATVPGLNHTVNEIKIQIGTTTLTGGTITYLPDVFVAGTLNNYSTPLATYWKNGKAVTVSSNESGLNTICVSAKDVYVGGWERTNNLQLANYWKNGTKTTLGADGSAVYTMAINGTDVYTGGFEIISGFDLPRLWLNSEGTTVNVNDPIISKVITGNGACAGICYSAGIVYATGSYRNSQGRFSPWETSNNEVPANTIPNNDKHCFANAIFVSGSDKYEAGNQNNPTTGLAMATVWKNGEYTSLTSGENSVGVAKAVFVVGSDVYVAGYEQENYSGGGATFAKYWKNGAEVKLSTANSNATGIVVFDNDVYVSGWEHNGTRNVAMYWKNGTSVNLTDGTFTSAGNWISLQ